MRYWVLRRLICARLFVALWTVAQQAPLSMGFSRQEYWSGLPCPPPGDLLDPEIKPESPVSPGLAGGSFTNSALLEKRQAYLWSIDNTELLKQGPEQMLLLSVLLNEYTRTYPCSSSLLPIAKLHYCCQKRREAAEITVLVVDQNNQFTVSASYNLCWCFPSLNL